MPLDNTAAIQTPEQVEFRYRVAGPARRAFAYGVDLAVRAALVLGASLVGYLSCGATFEKGEQLSSGFQLLALFFLEWGYYVFFEILRNGQSPGKRALSLRVVRDDGYPMRLADSLLRNLLRAADFLPVGYVLGVVVMSADRRFRRLGDRLAGTMVIIENRHRIAEPIKLSPPPSPAEWEAIPQRPVPTAAERETLELFLRRRDLSPARRRELAETLALIFTEKMKCPPPSDPVRFLGLVWLRTGQHGGAFEESSS